MATLKRSELAISHLLRGGVIFSGSVLVIGWVLELTQGSSQSQTSAEAGVRSLNSLVAGLHAMSAQAWISMGLLLLISLPILRVALTFLIFLQNRDRLFSVLTLYVLLLLCASSLLGKAL